MPGALTRVVNGPCHNLFTRTGFAYYEYAEVRFRDSLNGSDHFADRLAGAKRFARCESVRHPTGRMF